MLVVGEKEVEANSVSVRQHKVGDKGSMSIEAFTNMVKEEIKNKVNHI